LNPEDSATFQNAIQIVHAGQARTAYEQFCILASNNANRNHPDLLLWIAETTPYYEEAQRAINAVSTIAPYHPGLPRARTLLARWHQPISPMPSFQVEAYRCPICGTSVQPVIMNKISPLGWTIFAILIIGIITIEFCWLGFLLRTNVIECPMCNGNLKGLI
jgi:hypothetical protein